MEAVGRHPFAVVGVLAALALLVALLVPLPGADGAGSDDPAASSPSQRAGLPTPSTGASPSMRSAAESEDEGADGLVRRPMTVRGDLPGLAGNGGAYSIRMRRITLSARSSEPIGVVGYLVPTSRNRSSGTARGVGRTWSLSTTVYGRPDYAQMFLQAGPSGASITCTITVDGKVTEQRSSTGPYGQLFCQG